MTTWSRQHLDGFREAAQSLKLYRRAELLDENGRPLIKQLYVDPLPEDHVFRTLLKPHTTFVIGRRGTGKSTIFERVRHELKQSRSCIATCINLKSLQEAIRTDPSKTTKALTDEAKRFLLHRAFLQSLVSEIKANLEDRVKQSFFAKVREKICGSYGEIFYGLDTLLDYLNGSRFASPFRRPAMQGHAKDEAAPSSPEEQPVEAVTAGEIPDPAINLEEILCYLKELLNSASINYLYVFVDDYSELPEEAMRLVVDHLLAPLDNWSEELIKLKIAAYPGRIYYGSIDKAKIDEVHLDLLKAYGSYDVSAMEDKAIEFTRRLVERRIEHYCGVDPSFFFEIIKDDIWRALFYASMGNPRVLGYIIYFAYESHLIYDGKIGIHAIKKAALRYYEEKIEAYFTLNRFLHESFHERSSIYSLKELLEQIVNRAKELAVDRTALPVRGLKGSAPTSHFHVGSHYDSILSTLELNQFITRYHQSDFGNGEKVSIYALNYGLCQKQGIEFGRPVGKKEYRSYFHEKPFDYSSLVVNYIRMNQEIVCSGCGEKFELERLETLQLNGMICPSCREGACRVINLSRKHASILTSLHPELLLPQTQLGVLHALYSAKKSAEPSLETDMANLRRERWGERKVIEMDKGEARRVVQIRPDPDVYVVSRAYEEVRLDS